MKNFRKCLKILYEHCERTFSKLIKFLGMSEEILKILLRSSRENSEEFAENFESSEKLKKSY